jgi:hypothetical protein
LQPHRYQYWLNPNIDDVEAFQAKVKEICEIYLTAAELNAEENVQIYSTDDPPAGWQGRQESKR